MSIKLKDIDTKYKGPQEKEEGEKELEKLKKKLELLQHLMYAEGKHALLVVLQGMDASGKDGLIRNVFTGVNPQGCNVRSFKAPTEEELRHDFLWRIHHFLPAKGMFQVFNRSHYEDILYPTVNKTFDKKEIERRYKVINNFENHLQDSGTIILKFYLYISREEQAERLQLRVDDPTKHWKYNSADQLEAKKWDKYMETYERIFDKCSKDIPWVIVPADTKWHRNIIIAQKIVDTLEALKMEYPKNISE
jgi:PPK2 family polyphosphate:nucleotide phosphotransferase